MVSESCCGSLRWASWRLAGWLHGKDRRQVVRTTVQALMLFSWTAVAVWAWDTGWCMM